MLSRTKAKKLVKRNPLLLVALLAIVTLTISQLITVYHFNNVIYVKSLPMAEDPLEAWSEASYVVWEYNSTHYCSRNMSTRAVVGSTGEYLGTSDDDAIQFAINNCTAVGGTVYVKAPHTLGTYNAAVTLKDKVRLILENGAAGITVTIDSGATATLMDYHNFDFKRWDSGVLVGFIEDRSQAEDASYTIFKEGSYYFAKNGTTGAIDYSGTNATALFINVIEQNVDGLTVYVKAGTYNILHLDLSYNVYNPREGYITFQGDGPDSTKLQLTSTTNKSLFYYGGATRGYHITIKDLSIWRSTLGTNASDLIHFEKVNQFIFENIYFVGQVSNASAIYLSDCYFGKSEHLKIRQTMYGIRLVDDVDTCNANYFADIEFEAIGTYSVEIIGSTQNDFYHALFENTGADIDIYLHSGDSSHWSGECGFYDFTFADDTATVALQINGTSEDRVNTVVVSNGKFASDSYGVVLQNAHNITFVGGYFRYNEDASVYAGANVTDVVFVNPYITDTTFITGATYYSYSNSTYHVIP